jgi:small subunit ribosomal protein S4
MQRSSEYGKLLRNKQTLKRMYLLSEKQFVRIVKVLSAKYSKNKNITHDTSLFQFLERRLDSTVYRSGLAKTIIQARQMVNHGHFLLNGRKHNIPSYFVEIGDKIEVKEKLKSSPLYSQNSSENKGKIPSRVKLDKASNSIEVLNVPQV